jgi:hypothetical protein
MFSEHKFLGASIVAEEEQIRAFAVTYWYPKVTICLGG